MRMNMLYMMEKKEREQKRGEVGRRGRRVNLREKNV
jgi:hypothetical protein